MSAQDLPELVLVEDSPDDEKMSLRGLSQSGIPCRVTVKRDGAEALAHLLDEKGPLPALIVLDFQLPKFNGLQVLTHLRNNDRTRLVPVVIFSSCGSAGILEECYRVGANSCVRKPNDAKQYFDRLAWITRYWLTVNASSDEAPMEPTSRIAHQGRSLST